MLTVRHLLYHIICNALFIIYIKRNEILYLLSSKNSANNYAPTQSLESYLYFSSNLWHFICRVDYLTEFIRPNCNPHTQILVCSNRNCLSFIYYQQCLVLQTNKKNRNFKKALHARTPSSEQTLRKHHFDADNWRKNRSNTENSCSNRYTFVQTHGKERKEKIYI